MEDNQLNIDEYIKALEKMKKSPRDRLGILGELGITGLGATAGLALSGTVASTVGIATIAGSTTLAAVFGGVLVTKTPVIWIVGAAIVGGGLAYATGQLIRSGGECDTIRKYSVKELECRVRQLQLETQSSSNDDKLLKIITILQDLVANSMISQQKSTELLVAIEKRRISMDEAFDIVQGFLIKEKSE